MKTRFPKIFLIALLIPGCSSTVKIPRTGILESAPPKPEPFREFHSVAGTLAGRPGFWNLGWDTTATARWAEQGLVRIADPTRRVSVFQAEFPPGEFSRTSLDQSLAYLFKVDASMATPPAGFEGFRVFLPPRDSTRCGLLRATDSNLVFLQIRGPADSPGSPCRPEGLEFAAEEIPAAAPRIISLRFLAVLLNTAGLKALEDSALKIAERRFQQALAVDATVPEYLANQAAVFALRNDPAGGMNLLQRHPDLLSRSGQLCGIQGSFFEELHRYPEARDWALRALELEPGDREWLINLSDALWGMGERVQSKNVLLKHFAERPGFRLGVYLAGTHLGLEEYENALAVLEQLHADSPSTAKSQAYELRAYLGLRRFDEGLTRLHDWGNQFIPTGENLFLKAACLFNLKLFRQAGEAVQQSLSLSPSDREAQELQSRIAALLGDKSNQILRSPIEPLRTGLIGSQLWKQARDSGWVAAAPPDPISLFHQQVVFQWLPRGRWKQTRHLFFLVPDSRRLFRFSELTFDVNAGFERLFVNRLQVYDSAWKPTGIGRLSDCYVTKNPDASLHPENLIVHVPLRLKPGKVFVEALVTSEAQLASAEFPYVRFDHGAGYPVLRSRFDILHPPRNLIVAAYGEARVDSLPDRLSVHFDSPALPADSRLVPGSEELGSGFSASPFTTWREVGLRYLGELQKAGIELTRPPFRVVEVAGELLGRPGVDPVRTLFRFVRDSIRYDNYEFSRHASLPDSAPLVLGKGFSDCKGHALLLSQLLAAAGFHAFPTLVNLQRAGDPGQPNIGQFNHMVVYFPRQKGQGPYFLDPTEKFSAFRRFPLHLEGRNALMLEPENPRLLTIPELDSSGEHSVQVFHELEVDGSRLARGRDSLVLRGKAAAEFREHLNDWNPATRNQNLLSWLSSSYSAFNEDSFRILGERDPDEPLVFVLRHHGRFPALDGSQSFNHFPKLELSFLRFPEASRRRSPVHFPHEALVESNWIYRLPPGFAWKSLSLAREIEEQALRWRFSIQQNDPGTISLKQQWKISPFFAEPDEYRRLRTEWDPVLQHCGLRLVISKM